MLKVKAFRAILKLMTRLLWLGKSAKNLKVLDAVIQGDAGEIPLRIYRPEVSGDLPVVLYFHGGGFVLGDLDTVDAACRDICVNAEYVVVSVDYRLAPEHPFPAAIEDALFAVRWVSQHAADLNIDSARLFVAGDSAGGNLAAVVAQQLSVQSSAQSSTQLSTRLSAQPATQRSTQTTNLIKGQILIYPVTHHYRLETRSYEEKASGHGLTRDSMIWFWDLYYKNSAAIPAGDYIHPLSTPLACSDCSGLPPALVLVAEHDPLRDEGIAYANKMAEANVPVQQTLYNDAKHGFIGTLGPTTDHVKGIAEISAWLNSQAV